MHRMVISSTRPIRPTSTIRPASSASFVSFISSVSFVKLVSTVKPVELLASLVLVMALAGCSAQTVEQPKISFSGAEEHIKFIIEEYRFGEYGNYIPDFVINEFATNEFIIDSLADNYSEISEIQRIGEDLYRVTVDGAEIFDIYLVVSSDGKIEKIKVKAGTDDDE